MLGVCGAWALVAGLHLFGLWLANLWLIGLMILGLGWLTAIAVTVVALVVLWRRGGLTFAMPVLVPSVLASAVIVAVDWTSLFVHGFYRLNRADFAAVAVLADGGSVDSDEYYGMPLPHDLRHLAANGHVAQIGSFDASGPVALFLPV